MVIPVACVLQIPEVPVSQPPCDAWSAAAACCLDGEVPQEQEHLADVSPGEQQTYNQNSSGIWRMQVAYVADLQDMCEELQSMQATMTEQATESGQQVCPVTHVCTPCMQKLLTPFAHI